MSDSFYINIKYFPGTDQQIQQAQNMIREKTGDSVSELPARHSRTQSPYARCDEGL